MPGLISLFMILADYGAMWKMLTRQIIERMVPVFRGTVPNRTGLRQTAPSAYARRSFRQPRQTATKDMAQFWRVYFGITAPNRATFCGAVWLYHGGQAELRQTAPQTVAQFK
jgi:hypothetical protein